MTLNEHLELVVGPPSVAEYMHLRKECGLSQKTAEQSEIAIAGTWFSCHVRDAKTDQAIAMGRVIGDGGWCFLIADMATLPQYQGNGLGRRVIDTLVAHIRANAPQNPFITLVADPAGRRLYEQVGFSEINPSRAMELPWSR
ncbi:GNAT family N-acetyltransferase [Jonesiaceae bacterium BS-20]|uniref:GNAT family N-acetyltransferase n=1 Tax=Jonesiaceae bacterium BS-20 TaxID=3120821 RepID=A0AAU7DTQ6_9MICO